MYRQRELKCIEEVEMYQREQEVLTKEDLE